MLVLVHLLCVCVSAIIWMSSKPQKSGPDSIFPTPCFYPQPESRELRVSFDHTHTHTHPHSCARTLTLWNWHIGTASCFHILQVNISRLVKWDGIPACAGNVPRTICKPSSPPPPNSLQIVKLWISILGYTQRFLTLLSVGHLMTVKNKTKQNTVREMKYIYLSRAETSQVQSHVFISMIAKQ